MNLASQQDTSKDAFLNRPGVARRVHKDQPDNTALLISAICGILTDIETTWTRSKKVQSSVRKWKVRGSEECRDSRVHPRHVWRVCGDSSENQVVEV